MINYSLMPKTAASLLLIGGLAACGGGGGGDAAVVAPTTFTVAGTAATGAVFDTASISIISSDGTKYGGAITDLTGADGGYAITLPLTAKPPFVVQAVRDDKTLVSVVAEAKDTTTNITPVTNLIASRLSSSGDPAKLADELKAKPSLFDTAAVNAKVAEIVALIKPLADAVGDSTDPLNGKIVADGKGHDRVLDSLSISITPSSATSVNIEVAVKQKLPDGVNPPVIAFTNTTKPATAIPAVTAADLVPSGTAPLIADLLQRMTACYAVPSTERVTSGTTDAAGIKAPACRTLFSGDDPASYKHNGAIVSSTGAFSDIFGSASGAKFDRGSYEITRSTGDLVIAYRATDSSGNSTNNALVVTSEAAKLKVIGNQYQYSGSVNAYHQLRTFINQPTATYYSTGYNLSVTNKSSAGNSIFNRVEVTTPKGNMFILKPGAGSSYLPLVKSTGVTGTNFLHIRGVYTDAANSGKNPADADTNSFFASPAATDAEIAAFAAQGSWKFDYYLAANATTTPDATQYYRTRARAMTIAELQTQPLAKLTDANIADMKVQTKTSGSGSLYLPTPTTGPVSLDWVVPTGALAPTSIQVIAAAGGFSDTASVASTARTGAITCSSISNADTHCSASNYATGGRLVGLRLLASDPARREFASFYAIYTVTIP